MKKTLEDNTLTLFLEGRIDSSNAPALEGEVTDAVAAQPGAEIVLDAEKLEYISSAGLRVLMKLRRRAKKALPVLNVSPEVYEIFDITGFTELLDVKKRMRRVCVEGCELIGKGGNGAVYRLDRENIVKVYYGVSNPLEKIQRDREVSRSVLSMASTRPFPMMS